MGCCTVTRIPGCCYQMLCAHELISCNLDAVERNLGNFPWLPVRGQTAAGCKTALYVLLLTESLHCRLALQQLHLKLPCRVRNYCCCAHDWQMRPESPRLDQKGHSLTGTSLPRYDWWDDFVVDESALVDSICTDVHMCVNS